MRAQTTIDFAIGMAIFLGVMVFAFSFVPGILQPFELSDDEEPALSDRIADSLSQDVLGSPEQPYVLDRYCTVEFFNDTVPTGCNYDSTSLEEQFNLGSFQNLNITLQGNVTDEDTGVDHLCWAEDAGNGEPGLVERSHSNCGPTGDDVEFAKGDDVPEGHGTVITARRVVSLEGESVTLEVVVW